MADASTAMSGGDLHEAESTIGIQRKRSQVDDVRIVDSANSRERVLLLQPQEHDLTEHISPRRPGS